jgi:bla regulator protein BlaR1
MLGAIGDHLWQSTLVAAGAALLTLFLRNNRAQVRHAVWFAASIKFLVPFAALIAVGRRLGIAPPAAASPDRLDIQTYFVEAVARPFSMQPLDGPVAAVPAGIDWFAAFPYGLTVVWMVGAASLCLAWYLRWRRISRLIGAAAPLADDRVLTALRRLEADRETSPIPVVSAETMLEPGVFGIRQPILLWPAGIADQLADDHIEAILAHEICHVERRDNLWAAVHGTVQTLFWFHPMAWWIGARLIEERERSCDESVVAAGREPERYAESILKTCRYSLEAPALCMAGVTGDNLERRMEHIMSGSPITRLNWWKKSLVAAAGAAAVAGPVAVGIASGPPLRAQVQSATDRPSFEVASVKPNTSAGPNQIRVGMPGNGRFNITNMPLAELIRFAYELQPFQLTGEPDWANSQRFDVTATTNGNLGPGVIRQMVQSLLAERFNLAAHTETREMAIYEMVLARGDGRLGEKLREAGPECAPMTLPPGMKPPPPPPPPGAGARAGLPPGCPMIFGNGFMSARRTSMEQLARNLSRTVRRIVVDKTGLTGFYDADLEFSPDTPLAPQAPGAPQFPAPSSDAPAIYTAMQEQLGLKLESARGPVEMLVIDRVEPLIPD